jgi:hypothetical protein
LAASEALKKAIRKYDKEHTKQILLKLNKGTDADILQKLDEVDNKQGYIKGLIRDDIKSGTQKPDVNTHSENEVVNDEDKQRDI